MLSFTACLLLAACASAPRVAVVSAAKEPTDELSCMAECLQGSDETCESCADRCLHSADPPILVTSRR